MKKILTILFATTSLVFGQNHLPVLFAPLGNGNLQMVLDAGPTISLTATSTVINSGYYAAGNLTNVDIDLTASNIKSNVTLFGIVGTVATNTSTVNTNIALIAASGQTNTYHALDNGIYQTGVKLPSPRFTLGPGLNSTNWVTDNLTGLIWMRQCSLAGGQTWNTQLDYLAAVNAASWYGRSDWRMPTVRELLSVLDYRFNTPTISNIAGTGRAGAWDGSQWWGTDGDPFYNIFILPAFGASYWTSTSLSQDSAYAWYVNLQYGGVHMALKANTNFLYNAWFCAGP